MTTDSCTPHPQQLLSIPAALEKIYTAITPLQAFETVTLTEALGRVLAQAQHSPMAIPSARNSAMDGYAFRSMDLQPDQTTTLRLSGTSWAGKPYPAQLQPGECVRIFTGANLPDGADSVIIQEQVVANAQQIVLPANTSAHEHIRQIGEDVRQGQLLLNAGKLLQATDLALLAATGISRVPVIRQLKIAFCSTGDELVPLGHTPGAGQIFDSNRYLLRSLLDERYYQLTDLGILADDAEALKRVWLDAAEHYDVLISTGGVSVGDADHVKSVLEQCGAINFWKLAIKPGKPLAFGKINHCWFFGLPGNPVAVFTTYQQIVAPALRHFCAMPARQALRFNAHSTEAIKKSAGRTEFQRGLLQQDAAGVFHVTPTGAQGSNILSTLSQANCFIILPAETTRVASGEAVLVEPFNTWY